MSRTSPIRLLCALFALAVLWPAAAVGEGTAPAVGLVDFSTLPQTNPQLRVCEGKRQPPKRKTKWRKKRSRILSAAAGARHVAEDVVGTPGSKLTLRGKFQYGRIGKDLKAEDVLVQLHDCSGWTRVGEGTTDGDGWMGVQLTAPVKPGVYAVAFTVKGDRSQVFSRLWVLPAGQRLVVVDIDGTLTTDDEQIKNEVLKDHFNEIGAGRHEPKKWAGSVELTRALAARGDVLVYLSGRPYWLIPHSRHWLNKHGFAPGIVIHTRQHREVAPEISGVGMFKRDRMQALRTGGFEIAEGYGNAATDVWAYAAVGLAGPSTWIIGPLAKKGSAHDVQDGWEAVVESLASPKKD